MTGQRFVVGGTYRPRGGPSRDSPVVITKADDETGRYTFKGKGWPGPTILYGCEHMWERVHDVAPPVAPPASFPTMTAPAASWHRGGLVAFDLEATGVDPERDRIVTAAVVRASADGKHTTSWLADPGVEIPAEATAVHGITTEQARRDGQPLGRVVAEVLDALAEALGAAGTRSDPARPLVVFNAPYDLTMLDRMARLHDLAPLIDRVPALRVVDPLVVDKWLHGFRKGPRQLLKVCEHRGVTLPTAHDAGADALAAAQLAWVLAEKGAVTRRARDRSESEDLFTRHALWARVRYDLDALHAAQQQWHAAEMPRLADYFRSEGRHAEADSIRPEWPYVPKEATAV